MIICTWAVVDVDGLLGRGLVCQDNSQTVKSCYGEELNWN